MSAATPSPTTGESGRRFGPKTREIRAALELFALCGIAFAQPTFDLLGKNTGIFATRGSSAFDLIVISLLVLLVPAAVLYAIEVAVGLVLPRVRRYAHALLCGIPIGIFVEEILKRTTDMAPTRLVHLGVLSGLLGALAVLRLDWVRQWFRVLAIAPALFAVLFLFASPASSVVFGGKPTSKDNVVAKNPKRVVVVVYDEFPEQSLLDGTGKIDAELFPNFAKLASESTWYRNDTTVAPYTERAVPAILTGRLPPKGNVVPSSADYPDNLFTFLRGVYPLNVHEAVTQLCPRTACAAKAGGGTGLTSLKLLGKDTVTLWKDFASPKRSTVNFSEDSVVQFGLPQARQFVSSLQPGTGPELDFVHIELPHEPWHLLPDLKDNQHLAPQQGASKLVWQKDAWPAESARRQHLLQVQATDVTLGRITNRLKAIGAWKDSLVVVTADHGVSFRPNEGIRSVTKNEGNGNYTDIMWTPLFFKYPGQAAGVVDDRPAQSIDVFPTIADVIKAKIPWKVDGSSLLDPPRAEFPREFDQTKGNSFTPPDAIGPKPGQRYLLMDPAGFQDVLKYQAVPPSGEKSLRVYRVGPYGGLVGRSVAELPVGPVTRPTLANVGAVPKYDFIDPDAYIAPWTYMEAIISNLDEDTWIAVGLNGKIAAVGQALPFDGKPTGILTTIVGQQFAVKGPNQLKLYAISGTPDAPQLRDLPVYRGPGE